MGLLVWEPGAEYRFHDCDHLREVAEKVKAQQEKAERDKAES